MRPSLLTTLLIAAACAEGDVSTQADAGSITPGAEAGFTCPDPLPTATLDAGPVDPDAGEVMGGLGPPLVPETCWEATSDWRTDYTCDDPSWASGACGEGTRIHRPNQDRTHIYLPEPVTYERLAPSSGPHRPYWARWGEYTYLPPQRWLHNLEHGGVAFLYHPCASDETKDAIRAFVDAHEGDETGPLRYVMTPYPGLATELAVVAWEYKMSANCFSAEDVSWFLRLHYRNGPEDVAVDGRYIYTWQGR